MKRQKILLFLIFLIITAFGKQKKTCDFIKLSKKKYNLLFNLGF
jgi:hypothetical protein